MAANLNIIIIGGGLVGLTTALAFRRIGHNVTIYEKSSFSSEVGAAVSISPNATRILERFGIDLKAAGGVLFKVINARSASSLQDVMPPRLVNDELQYGAILYSAHRSDVHTVIHQAAVSETGSGLPAKLLLSSRVAAYDADAGTVNLQDDTVHAADLIIAADGFHSKAATYINGYDCPAYGTEDTVIRFMLPSQDILDDPITAPLFDRGSGQLTMYVTRDGQSVLAQYDCRDSKLQNFGMYIPKTIIEGDHDH